MIDRLLRRISLRSRIVGAFLLLLLIMGANTWFVINQLRLLAGTLTDAGTPVQIIISWIGVGYLATLLVTLIIALVIQRSVTRPIERLRLGTEAYRAGQLGEKIPVVGTDELAVLAETYNQMTVQLNRSYKELEEIVRHRTKDLEQRALQLQVAAEVARASTTVREMEQLIGRTVDLIHDRFDYYYVGILLLDDSGKFMVLRAATGEAGKTLIQRGFKNRVGDVGIVGYVSHTNTARIVNDVDADYVFQKDPLLPETRSEMAVPLTVGGVILGVLDIQSNQVNAFGDDELAAMQVIANQLAIAIQNVRLVNELERRLEEIQQLYQRYTQEDWAKSELRGKVMGYQYDLATISPGVRNLQGDVMAKLKDGETIHMSPAEAKQEHDKRTLITPLVMNDKVIGLVGFEDEDPKRTWMPEEIALVQSISNQIAVAMDNARLLEDTQLQTKHLRLLQEVTSVAASNIKLDQLLYHVSQKLRAGFNATHCGIALMEPDGKTAKLVSNISVDPVAAAAVRLGTMMTISDIPVLAQVLKAHKSVAVSDAQSSPQTANMQDLVFQSNSNLIAVMPLAAREELIGVVLLGINDPRRSFPETDLQLLDQISLQISSAIEVARNYERAAIQAEREKRMGEITTRIRETLDVERVLRTAVDEIYRMGNVDEVALSLPGEQKQEGGPDDH